MKNLKTMPYHAEIIVLFALNGFVLEATQRQGIIDTKENGYMVEYTDSVVGFR